MIARAHRGFWEAYRQLPAAIRDLADKKYALWQRNPFHPSLHFKIVQSDLWSIRINLKYRALARAQGEMFVWFWIGTHDDYERLLKSR